MNFNTPSKEELDELCNICIFVYQDFQFKVREKIANNSLDEMNVFRNDSEGMKFTESVDWQLFEMIAYELVEKYNMSHDTQFDNFTSIVIMKTCQKEKDWNECYFLGQQKINSQNNVFNKKIDSMDLFKSQMQMYI